MNPLLQTSWGRVLADLRRTLQSPTTTPPHRHARDCRYCTSTMTVDSHSETTDRLADVQMYRHATDTMHAMASTSLERKATLPTSTHIDQQRPSTISSNETRASKTPARIVVQHHTQASLMGSDGIAGDHDAKSTASAVSFREHRLPTPRPPQPHFTKAQGAHHRVHSPYWQEYLCITASAATRQITFRQREEKS